MTSDLFEIGGLLFLGVGAVIWFFRQGKKDAELDETESELKEANKTVVDMRSAKDFLDRINRNAALSERVRLETNPDK